MEQRQFVLIVDGNKDDAKQHRGAIEIHTSCAALVVNDLDTAYREFSHLQDRIVAIIIDGAVPASSEKVEIGEDRLTSIPFVQAFRQSGFTGLIVAASSRQDYYASMTQYGCNSGVPKDEAASLVIDWLNGNYQ